MATVTVKSTFTDGEELLIQVRGGSTYPDSLSELRATAIGLYADALALARVQADES